MSYSITRRMFSALVTYLIFLSRPQLIIANHPQGNDNWFMTLIPEFRDGTIDSLATSHDEAMRLAQLTAGKHPSVWLIPETHGDYAEKQHQIWMLNYLFQLKQLANGTVTVLLENANDLEDGDEDPRDFNKLIDQIIKFVNNPINKPKSPSIAEKQLELMCKSALSLPNKTMTTQPDTLFSLSTGCLALYATILGFKVKLVPIGHARSDKHNTCDNKATNGSPYIADAAIPENYALLPCEFFSLEARDLILASSVLSEHKENTTTVLVTGRAHAPGILGVLLESLSPDKILTVAFQPKAPLSISYIAALENLSRKYCITPRDNCPDALKDAPYCAIERKGNDTRQCSKEIHEVLERVLKKPDANITMNIPFQSTYSMANLFLGKKTVEEISNYSSRHRCPASQ